MPSLKLTINGQERELDAVDNLSVLIDRLGMRLDRVAVELNRQLVPRERWAATPVSSGDKLEIVHFVGGGLRVGVDAARPALARLARAAATILLIS
jgi:sulfur carrier protein